MKLLRGYEINTKKQLAFNVDYIVSMYEGKDGTTYVDTITGDSYQVDCDIDNIVGVITDEDRN